MAARAIVETHLFEEQHDPRKHSGSHSQYLNKYFACMLSNFSYHYPPPQRKKDIPVGIIMADAASYDPSCQLALCTADLIQISLFLCLLSYEYTKTQ